MKLNNLFNRLGENNIQNYFVSKEAIEIIKLMSNGQLQHPAKLRQCISTHFTHLEMLRTKKIRGLLLDRMHPSELIKLLQKITNISLNEDNVYKEIHKIPFNKNSTSEKILFEFFEEEIPEELDKVPKLSNMEKIVPKRSLFDYQRKAYEEIMTYLNNEQRCLLHMPTGSGKTITAMRVISAFFSKTKPVLIIWLAYSEELCEQAIDEFKETWKYVGDRELRVFRFFRNHSIDLIKNTDIDKDGLIVAGLGKIFQKSKRDELFLGKLADRVNLVVMDEAHQAIAPAYSEILELLTEKRSKKIPLLGLSATPGRSSESKSGDLSEFFNSNRVRLTITGYKNPIKYLIKKGYLADPKIKPINFNLKLNKDDLAKIFNSDIDIPDLILDKIGKDIHRTLLVISQIQYLINSKKHKRIIVFGASVKNSRDISMILTYFNKRSFHIDANTDPIIKNQYINEYKSDSNDVIVMCNVGVFTTGFDAPKTSAVVIARPTKSLVLYNQMVGRAMRGINVGGNKTCEIRIIKDDALSQFTNPVDNFFKWDDVW